MDSKSSREVVRLIQLEFVSSFRWDSATSTTQHFEMFDTVDVGSVEILKCRHFIRDGGIQTMYEERLDQLKRQLVDKMRSELELMAQC